MRNARLDELQVGIKIGVGNSSNLSYANDSTLMAESKEELKNLLMRVKKDSERAGLKLNIKKVRSWHQLHYFMANRGGNSESSDKVPLLGF